MKAKTIFRIIVIIGFIHCSGFLKGQTTIGIQTGTYFQNRFGDYHPNFIPKRVSIFNQMFLGLRLEQSFNERYSLDYSCNFIQRSFRMIQGSFPTIIDNDLEEARFKMFNLNLQLKRKIFKGFSFGAGIYTNLSKKDYKFLRTGWRISDKLRLEDSGIRLSVSYNYKGFYTELGLENPISLGTVFSAPHAPVPQLSLGYKFKITGIKD